LTIIASIPARGDSESVEVTWRDVPAGAHQVYVIVDGDGLIDESDELNNQGSQVILVASERAFLAAISR
jgi:subtilase family serine protease